MFFHTLSNILQLANPLDLTPKFFKCQVYRTVLLTESWLHSNRHYLSESLEIKLLTTLNYKLFFVDFRKSDSQSKRNEIMTPV